MENTAMKTAAERFAQLAPEDKRLADAYIDAISGMTDKESALVQKGYDAVMASEIMQGKNPKINPAQYVRCFMEIVICAGRGDATAWGVIRATIREQRQKARAAR